MRRGLISVGLLVLACSHAAVPPRPVPDDEDLATVRSQDRRAAELEQGLSVLTSGATPPDCVQICDLVEQICDLSRRICLIAARHPEDPELSGRCSAGEQRCRRSRDRVPSGCPCRTP